MSDTQQTRTVFCAKCQEDTPHTAVVDANGEFVFACTTPDCDRFIKLPAATTPEEADAYFNAHKKESEGQVSLEAQEVKLLTLMGATEVVSEPSQTETIDVAESSQA